MENITLTPEQAERIRTMLFELSSIKDNLLYEKYSPAMLQQELAAIDEVIGWLQCD